MSEMIASFTRSRRRKMKRSGKKYRESFRASQVTLGYFVEDIVRVWRPIPVI